MANKAPTNTGSANNVFRMAPRHRLSRKFIDALSIDFNRNGASAIEQLRIDSPSKYCELIAGLIPQESTVNVNATGSFAHLHVPVSSTAEFIEGALRGRSDSAFEEFVPDGPLLLGEVRAEEAGCGASMVIPEVPGGSEKP